MATENQDAGLPAAETRVRSAKIRDGSKAAAKAWLLAVMLAAQVISLAQTSADKGSAPASSPTPGTQPYDFPLEPVPLKSLPHNLFTDQKKFWTGPLHMNETQWQWAVPMVMIGAGFIAEDLSIEKHAPTSPTTLSRANTFSNAGLGAFVGIGGGLYLWGHLTHNDQQRETGLLSGEAAIDAVLDTEVFKYAAGRNRPYTGDHLGRFFEGGTSFPSEHASVSWAIASVIAHEYPGTLTRILAYGLAGGVSAARFGAGKHFASDVVVGSALGWYSGWQVFRTHSRYNVSDLDKQSAYSKADETEKSEAVQIAHQSRKIGSSYVPLDNWVYPAVEKLAGLGYVKLLFLDSKPWTRIEIANLVNEADANLKLDENPPEEITALEFELQQEFAYELGVLEGKSNNSAKVETLYTRLVSITGPPLHDSYHFGQTIVNDFGRPYEQGFNTYDGFSGYATSGPFTVYVRGEYQHAPSAPGYSLGVRQVIASVDQTPLQPEVPIATTNQFTLLDTYAAAKAAGWNLSFGKQSLWWGPAVGGALLFSDNAEPILMFRANKTFVELPWIFRFLGPMKLDVFFGKLSGNEFPPRPLIHGEKISFHPGPEWEIGIERTSELGGVGRALTPGAIWESYVGVKSSFEYPANRDPGKRTLGFDASYRPQYLHNWATIYGDGLLPASNVYNVDNSHNPIYDPARTALRLGIYMPRVPGATKADFRVESVYTDPPTPRSIRGTYVYWDGIYKDLYTNKQNLIGDWIGREGMGFQAWSNYWFTPKSSLQISYRHAKVDKDFIPSGETVNDGTVGIQWWLHKDVSVSGSVQYEKWFAPVLAPTPQNNWTSTVEITFWPKPFSR
jgi:hypothetical protein